MICPDAQSCIRCQLCGTARTGAGHRNGVCWRSRGSASLAIQSSGSRGDDVDVLGLAAPATGAPNAGDFDGTIVLDRDLGRTLDAFLLALDGSGTRRRVVVAVEQVSAEGGLVSGSGLFLVPLLVALENVFSGEPFGADGTDKVLCDAVLGCIQSQTQQGVVMEAKAREKRENRRSASVLPRRWLLCGVGTRTGDVPVQVLLPGIPAGALCGIGKVSK